MLPCQHFRQEALGQKFQVFVKNGLFLLRNVFISDFLAGIRNQRLRIDHCAKYQLNWTNDKGTQILTWNDTKNGLMTYYLLPSDDISKIFMAFQEILSQSTFMLNLVVTGPQIKEKQRNCITTTSLYDSKIPQPE